MNRPMKYDPDADAMYVRLSSRKAWESLEINQNLNLDLDQNKRLVGVELLDVSKFVSALFGHQINMSRIRDLKVEVRSKDGREVILDIFFEGEKVRYAIPRAYTSPLVDGNAQ